MKTCRRAYEPLSKKPSKNIIAGIGSAYKSVDELALRFRNFYKEAHLVLFDFIIKQVWLEQQFLYNGTRRAGRYANGYAPDWAFSYFMRAYVGMSQKPLTIGFFLGVIPTYFAEFFPNFSDHDPFEESEYFKYPYKNVTFDHLAFVYQCHDRMEMLKEVEEKSMKIMEFFDWAANRSLSCRDSNDNEVYSIMRHSYFPFIKKNKIHGGKKA